jgi:hypothetical protein
MKNVTINRENYFHITEEVCKAKDEHREPYTKFMMGIINGEGATLTVDPNLDLDDVGGFFKMCTDTIQSVAAGIPPEVQTILEKLAGISGVEVSKVTSIDGLTAAIEKIRAKHSCTNPNCKIHG